MFVFLPLTLLLFRFFMAFFLYTYGGSFYFLFFHFFYFFFFFAFFLLFLCVFLNYSSSCCILCPGFLSFAACPRVLCARGRREEGYGCLKYLRCWMMGNGGMGKLGMMGAGGATAAGGGVLFWLHGVKRDGLWSVVVGIAFLVCRGAEIEEERVNWWRKGGGAGRGAGGRRGSLGIKKR